MYRRNNNFTGFKCIARRAHKLALALLSGDILVEIEFNADTDTYRYVVDGTEYYNSLYFTNPVDSIDNIRIATAQWSFGTDPGQALGYVDDLQLYNYSTSGTYTSAVITAPYYITSVKPYWNTTTDEKTNAWIEISRDGGSTWNSSAVLYGSWYGFPTEAMGNELQYRVKLSSTCVCTTPVFTGKSGVVQTQTLQRPDFRNGP